ncbi:MAG: SdpI family protein, partial [Oscillospiraceae bacterium]|nr:SdpI family protein [Oscillospiraceae bacterium]
AWQYSNRFGGAALFTAGVLIIAESLIFRGMIVLYIMVGILATVILAAVIYSYHAYKKSIA